MFEMNWHKLCVLQVICVEATVAAASDQPVFLVSFFPNMTYNNLFFTSCEPGTCSVNYNDGSRKSLSVSLPGDDVVSFKLPVSTAMPYGVHTSNKAILISCTVPTSVFSSSYDGFVRKSDAFAAIPISDDFTDYIVPSAGMGYALTAIAALYPKTKVTITFNSTCIATFYGSHVFSGDTLIEYPDALDVLTLGTEISGSCDMGGSRIRSNKPIALYSGATSLYSRMMTQILPTVYWGSEFVVPNPYGNPRGNVLRVTALDNDTAVSLASFSTFTNQSSNVSVKLESGEHHDSVHSFKNVIITSSKPVQVTRLVVIEGLHFLATTIHGTHTFKSNYAITTMDNHKSYIEFYNNVNVVTSQNCEDDIVVNGKSPKSLQLSWTRVGSSNFSVCSVAVPPGPVYARSRSGKCLFSLEIHGHGKYGALYGYSAFQDCPILDPATTEMARSTASIGVSPYATTSSDLPTAPISSSRYSGTTSTSPTTSYHKSPPVTLSTRPNFDHQLLDKSISFTCSREGWLIAVDLDQLKHNFPNIDAGQVYLSEDMCQGQYDPKGHVVRFNITYGSCQTEVEEIKDKLVYKNFLFYPEVTYNVMTAINWRYDLDCQMKREESVKLTFNPSLNALLHGHGSGQLKVPESHLKFYADNLYQREIIGNPLSINVGSQVYVEVTALVEPGNKMIVDNCFASPASNAFNGNPPSAYPLIRSKCPAESITHLLSGSRDRFHFSFQALQFRQQHGDISVSCHIHLCLATDTNQDCTQSCTK